MTDRLSIYQGACAVIGARRITDLTDDRLTLRELNGVWDRGGIDTCLQVAYWNFATRTVQISYNSSIEPDFGYQKVFDKTDDWLLTAGISADGYQIMPLTAYRDENRYIFADVDTLYASFISNDTSFGLDFSKWPANFTRYVEAWFGQQIHERVIKNNDKKLILDGEVKKLLREAKAKDALDKPTRFPPRGSWARARSSGTPTDGGSRTRLIG